MQDLDQIHKNDYNIVKNFHQMESETLTDEKSIE